MDHRKPGKMVWFHRTRAALWLIGGTVALIVPALRESVMLVLIASFYANVVSDLGAAEAADNSEVMEELAKLRATIEQQARDRP